MSLLTAVNEVCDICSLDVFETVYGSTDPNAGTMLALAKEAGDEIARRVDWQGMLKTATPSDAAYALPLDFQRLAPGGAVRSPSREFARAIVNSGQWAIAQSSTSLPYFFIEAGKINIVPAGYAAAAMVDYVSKNWVKHSVGAPGDTFTADDDTTLFPERLLIKGLIWRWRRQKGLNYEDQLSEFEADLVQEIKADRGTA